jgi:hypothetical protein
MGKIEIIIPFVKVIQVYKINRYPKDNTFAYLEISLSPVKG